MNTPPAPPQFSEDGRWWWTGAEWVPAEHAPKPPPPQQDAGLPSVRSDTAERTNSTCAGPPRSLLTNYRDGQVFVDGWDVIILHKGKEDKVPVGELRIDNNHRDRLNRRIWAIESSSRVYRIVQPDQEAGLQWLLEYRTDAEIQQAVLDIYERRKVVRTFTPGVASTITVAVDKGYLMAGVSRIPLHVVDFASTEGSGGSLLWSLTLFGSGTRLGQVQGFPRPVNDAADWINRLVVALRRHQQKAVQEAREKQVPLIKCLYCGTRVQDIGRCIQCGAPLPG